MNRERAKELLPIIQALVDGETIQFRDDASSLKNLYPGSEFSDWQTVPDEPDLKFHDYREYRIKPEPRVFWIDPAADNSSDYWWLTQEEYDSGQWDYCKDSFIRTIEDLQDE